MIRLESRLLPALVLLLVVVQLTVPWKGWAILLGGLSVMWVISWFWARSLLHGLTLKREMRFGWARVGDRLEERFTVTNQGWAPALWLEIIDHSSMPGYDVSRVTGVGAATQHRWRTGGLCIQRGLFTLGPTTLRTGDPLGIYTVEVAYSASETLMVTPPVLPLPAIDVAPGGRAGDGRPRPYTLERTVPSGSVRAYEAGDPLPWIHWPITAHRGNLHVRLFDGAPVGDWWIILDVAGAVQAGEGQNGTEEHAIILAASLADRGIREGRNVGLLAHGESPLWLLPRGGASHRLTLLRSLALLTTGEMRVAELLERSRTSLGRYSSIIVITADVEASWLDRLLLMRRRGIIPTVLLLDVATFGGAGSAGPASAMLSQFGITHHIITRELLDRLEAMPGKEGTWEWRVLGFGRVVATRRPSSTSWKELR